jgi:hypothetical protein
VERGLRFEQSAESVVSADYLKSLGNQPFQAPAPQQEATVTSIEEQMMATYSSLQRQFDQISQALRAHEAFKAELAAHLAQTTIRETWFHLAPALDGRAAFTVLKHILADRPTVAARDVLLLIDEWTEQNFSNRINELLDALSSLKFGWNLQRSNSVDVLLAALSATRYYGTSLPSRESLIRKTLGSLRWRLHARSVRRSIRRLA